LVALHGSWNRTRKDGYKVVSLHWDASDAISERDFLVGFLENEDVIGRPVDVAEGPDGAFYVSDDYAGAIYRVASGGRIASGGTGAAAAPGTPPALAEATPLAGVSAEDRAAGVTRGRVLYARLECARCHDPEAAAPGVVAPRLVAL